MGKAHSPSFLQEPLRACSARARGSFLVEKKGTKDSPKRKFPLWNLLLGDSPLGNFALRSSLPLTAPAAGECQVLHLSLRAVSSYVVAVTFLGVGFQKGLAPFVGGVGTKRSQLNLCLLSFHKKVGAGCGSRRPAIFLQRVWRRSAAPSHACAYKRNGFTECTGAGLGATLQQRRFGE